MRCIQYNNARSSRAFPEPVDGALEGFRFSSGPGLVPPPECGAKAFLLDITPRRGHQLGQVGLNERWILHTEVSYRIMCLCVNLARAGPLKIPGNGVSLSQDLLYMVMVMRLEEQPETGSPPAKPLPVFPLTSHATGPTHPMGSLACWFMTGLCFMFHPSYIVQWQTNTNTNGDVVRMFSFCRRWCGPWTRWFVSPLMYLIFVVRMGPEILDLSLISDHLLDSFYDFSWISTNCSHSFKP